MNSKIWTATLIAPRSDRPNTAFSTETNQSESSYSSYLISGPLFISWVLLVTLVLSWLTYVETQKCIYVPPTRTFWNQSNCTITQHGPLVANGNECGYLASLLITEIYSTFPEKHLSWGIIFQRCTERISTAHAACCVEIVYQCSYSMSRDLAKFLNRSKNTVLMPLIGLCQLGYPKTCPATRNAKDTLQW